MIITQNSVVSDGYINVENIPVGTKLSTNVASFAKSFAKFEKGEENEVVDVFYLGNYFVKTPTLKYVRKGSLFNKHQFLNLIVIKNSKNISYIGFLPIRIKAKLILDEQPVSLSDISYMVASAKRYHDSNSYFTHKGGLKENVAKISTQLDFSKFEPLKYESWLINKELDDSMSSFYDCTKNRFNFILATMSKNERTLPKLDLATQLKFLSALGYDGLYKFIEKEYKSPLYKRIKATFDIETGVEQDYIIPYYAKLGGI